MTATACNSDDDIPPDDPAEVLPSATEVGAGTFACLIDGEPFFPSNFGLSAPSAFYQFVGNGEFALSINAARNGSTLIGVATLGFDVPPIEETEYELTSEMEGNFAGSFSLDGGLILRSTTSDENPGRLTITRFENENEFIVSGTFEFTVLDNDGNEIRITEGRFDLPFTN